MSARLFLLKIHAMPTQNAHGAFQLQLSQLVDLSLMLKSSQLLFSSALNLPKEEFQSSLRLIVNLSHLRAHAMLPSAHGASLLQLRLLAEIQLWLLSSHLLYSNAQTFHLRKKNSSMRPNQASEDSSPVCLEELSLKIEDIEAMASTKEAQAITVDQDLRTMREKEDTMDVKESMVNAIKRRVSDIWAKVSVVESATRREESMVVSIKEEKSQWSLRDIMMRDSENKKTLCLCNKKVDTTEEMESMDKESITRSTITALVSSSGLALLHSTSGT